MKRRQRNRKRAAVVPRKRRARSAPFALRNDADVSGELVDMGCPDCRGVLAVREDGHRGHLAFICSIGHAYSGESLVSSKEEQLENTLWSAIEVYQEIALLHRELSASSRADGARASAGAYQRRAKRATTLAADLRELIGKDVPAGAERAKG